MMVATVARVTGAPERTRKVTRTVRGSTRSTRVTSPTSTPWYSTGDFTMRPETASWVSIW